MCVREREMEEKAVSNRPLRWPLFGCRIASIAYIPGVREVRCTISGPHCFGIGASDLGVRIGWDGQGVWGCEIRKSILDN